MAASQPHILTNRIYEDPDSRKQHEYRLKPHLLPALDEARKASIRKSQERKNDARKSAGT